MIFFSIHFVQVHTYFRDIYLWLFNMQMSKWKSWERETKTIEYQYANGMYIYTAHIMSSPRVYFCSSNQRKQNKEKKV